MNQRFRRPSEPTEERPQFLNYWSGHREILVAVFHLLLRAFRRMRSFGRLGLLQIQDREGAARQGHRLQTSGESRAFAVDLGQ